MLFSFYLDKCLVKNEKSNLSVRNSRINSSESDRERDNVGHLGREERMRRVELKKKEHEAEENESREQHAKVVSQAYADIKNILKPSGKFVSWVDVIDGKLQSCGAPADKSAISDDTLISDLPPGVQIILVYLANFAVKDNTTVANYMSKIEQDVNRNEVECFDNFKRICKLIEEDPSLISILEHFDCEFFATEGKPFYYVSNFVLDIGKRGEHAAKENVNDVLKIMQLLYKRTYSEQEFCGKLLNKGVNFLADENKKQYEEDMGEMCERLDQCTKCKKLLNTHVTNVKTADTNGIGCRGVMSLAHELNALSSHDRYIDYNGELRSLDFFASDELTKAYYAIYGITCKQIGKDVEFTSIFDETRCSYLLIHDIKKNIRAIPRETLNSLLEQFGKEMEEYLLKFGFIFICETKSCAEYYPDDVGGFVELTTPSLDELLNSKYIYSKIDLDLDKSYFYRCGIVQLNDELNIFRKEKHPDCKLLASAAAKKILSESEDSELSVCHVINRVINERCFIKVNLQGKLIVDNDPVKTDKNEIDITTDVMDRLGMRCECDEYYQEYFYLFLNAPFVHKYVESDGRIICMPTNFGETDKCVEFDFDAHGVRYTSYFGCLLNPNELSMAVGIIKQNNSRLMQKLLSVKNFEKPMKTVENNKVPVLKRTADDKFSIEYEEKKVDIYHHALTDEMIEYFAISGVIPTSEGVIYVDDIEFDEDIEKHTRRSLLDGQEIFVNFVKKNEKLTASRYIMNCTNGLFCNNMSKIFLRHFLVKNNRKVMSLFLELNDKTERMLEDAAPPAPFFSMQTVWTQLLVTYVDAFNEFHRTNPEIEIPEKYQKMFFMELNEQNEFEIDSRIENEQITPKLLSNYFNKNKFSGHEFERKLFDKQLAFYGMYTKIERFSNETNWQFCKMASVSGIINTECQSRKVVAARRTIFGDILFELDFDRRNQTVMYCRKPNKILETIVNDNTSLDYEIFFKSIIDFLLTNPQHYFSQFVENQYRLMIDENGLYFGEHKNNALDITDKFTEFFMKSFDLNEQRIKEDRLEVLPSEIRNGLTCSPIEICEDVGYFNRFFDMHFGKKRFFGAYININDERNFESIVENEINRINGMSDYDRNQFLSENSGKVPFIKCNNKENTIEYEDFDFNLQLSPEILEFYTKIGVIVTEDGQFINVKTSFSEEQIIQIYSHIDYCLKLYNHTCDDNAFRNLLHCCYGNASFATDAKRYFLSKFFSQHKLYMEKARADVKNILVQHGDDENYAQWVDVIDGEFKVIPLPTGKTAINSNTKIGSLPPMVRLILTFVSSVVVNENTTVSECFSYYTNTDERCKDIFDENFEEIDAFIKNNIEFISFYEHCIPPTYLNKFSTHDFSENVKCFMPDAKKGIDFSNSSEPRYFLNRVIDSAQSTDEQSLHALNFKNVFFNVKNVKITNLLMIENAINKLEIVEKARSNQEYSDQMYMSIQEANLSLENADPMCFDMLKNNEIGVELILKVTSMGYEITSEGKFCIAKEFQDILQSEVFDPECLLNYFRRRIKNVFEEFGGDIFWESEKCKDFLLPFGVKIDCGKIVEIPTPSLRDSFLSIHSKLKFEYGNGLFGKMYYFVESESVDENKSFDEGFSSISPKYDSTFLELLFTSTVKELVSNCEYSGSLLRILKGTAGVRVEPDGKIIVYDKEDSDSDMQEDDPKKTYIEGYDVTDQLRRVVSNAINLNSYSFSLHADIDEERQYNESVKEDSNSSDEEGYDGEVKNTNTEHARLERDSDEKFDIDVQYYFDSDEIIQRKLYDGEPYNELTSIIVEYQTGKKLVGYFGCNVPPDKVETVKMCVKSAIDDMLSKKESDGQSISKQLEGGVPVLINNPPLDGSTPDKFLWKKVSWNNSFFNKIELTNEYVEFYSKLGVIPSSSGVFFDIDRPEYRNKIKEIYQLMKQNIPFFVSVDSEGQIFTTRNASPFADCFVDNITCILRSYINARMKEFEAEEQKENSVEDSSFFTGNERNKNEILKQDVGDNKDKTVEGDKNPGDNIPPIDDRGNDDDLKQESENLQLQSKEDNLEPTSGKDGRIEANEGKETDANEDVVSKLGAKPSTGQQSNGEPPVSGVVSNNESLIERIDRLEKEMKEIKSSIATPLANIETCLQTILQVKDVDEVDSNVVKKIVDNYRIVFESTDKLLSNTPTITAASLIPRGKTLNDVDAKTTIKECSNTLLNIIDKSSANVENKSVIPEVARVVGFSILNHVRTNNLTLRNSYSMSRLEKFLNCIKRDLNVQQNVLEILLDDNRRDDFLRQTASIVYDIPEASVTRFEMNNVLFSILCLFSFGMYYFLYARKEQDFASAAVKISSILSDDNDSFGDCEKNKEMNFDTLATEEMRKLVGTHHAEKINQIKTKLSCNEHFKGEMSELDKLSVGFFTRGKSVIGNSNGVQHSR